MSGSTMSSSNSVAHETGRTLAYPYSPRTLTVTGIPVSFISAQYEAFALPAPDRQLVRTGLDAISARSAKRRQRHSAAYDREHPCMGPHPTD